ncbi:MAG: EpsI family protein [Aquabacterium sp.]|uniref:exosortase-associated protein EpsI, B-type n=1 Tax=Aquabacterium sp. TaxID=1872578 RepID=UPI0025C1E89A|nr:exosortase-associated protein EpsI, B-type [Aquabacterium sp.]MBI5927349.1 EpsI family protein [Aquabacterium sp.]
MTSNKTLAWFVAVSMALTAVVSHVFRPRPMPDAQARANTPLEQLFPSQFGDWRLDPSTAALIRPAFEQARRFQMYDQVLERTYLDRYGRRVMLSVAYGRQQSVGLQMHRPEVCYKAGGFRIADVKPGEFMLMGHKVPVTRLFASMEGRPEPITYWRLLGNELMADEQQFKLRQLSLGASGSIPDGLLVRVSSIDDDPPGAYKLHAEFAQAMAQAMGPAQRLRVLGW